MEALVTINIGFGKYKERLSHQTPHETRHNQAKRPRFKTRGRNTIKQIGPIGTVSADVVILAAGAMADGANGEWSEKQKQYGYRQLAEEQT